MLCQLSYRGSAAAIVARRGRLGELADPLCGSSGAPAGGRPAGPRRPRRAPAGAAARAAAAAAARPSASRDALLVGERVELGEQRRQLAVGGLLPEQVRAGATVQRVVEVLRAELGSRSARAPGARRRRRARYARAASPRRAAAARRRRRRARCRAPARAPPASPAAGRAGRPRGGARPGAPASRAASARNVADRRRTRSAVARPLVHRAARGARDS